MEKIEEVKELKMVENVYKYVKDLSPSGHLEVKGSS